MEKKVILVTGGSSGLGKTMCMHLAKAGYHVYGTSRKINGTEKMNGYELILMDVTAPHTIQSAINELIQKEGRLDVLINNAGISSAGPLEETTLEDAKSIFETNVFGLLNVTKAALPAIRKTKGHVINISSIAGEIALPYRGIYSASKFAVEALTESLSMETSVFGVKVLLIQPGDLNTNINQNRSVTAVSDHSPYQKIFKKQLADLEAHMNASMDPDVIGKLIVKILQDPHPQLRYQIGPISQKISTRIKRFLPGRLFEKIMKNHFRLD